MMKNLTQLSDRDAALIRAFYDKELSPTQLESFNNRIKTDPIFVKKVAKFHLLQKALIREEEMEEDFEEEDPIVAKTIPFWRNRRVFLAAAILLMISFPFWSSFFQDGLTRTEQQVLAKELNEEIDRYYNLNTSGSEMPVYGPELIAQGKIEEGLALMKIQLANQPDTKTNIAYYYGTSLLLYAKDYSQAIEFLTIAAAPQSDYKRVAAKNLVMAYALNNSIANAQQVLTQFKIPIADLPISIQRLLMEE